MNINSEILVIGAGPAGQAAAITAATGGARVSVIDDNPAPGGQIWRGDPNLIAKTQSAFQRLRVEYHPATKVLALNGDGSLLAQQGLGPKQFSAKTIILANGARERFMPFPGWTLPGVTGVGGLQALIKSGYPVAGKRIVIAGSGPLLLAAAHTARVAGAHVVMIAEQTDCASLARFALSLLVTPSKLMAAIRLRTSSLKSPYLCDSYVTRAHGQQQLESVTLRSGHREFAINCDLLACAYGLLPNTAMAGMLACDFNAQGLMVDRYQRTSVSNIFGAGEVCGIAGVECARIEGKIAALSALGETKAAERLFPQRSVWRAFGRRLSNTFGLRDALLSLPEAGTLICRCEDVAHKELLHHADWRSAKLQTRCGMGACQGAICGPICNTLYGWQKDVCSTPLAPASVATMIAPHTTNIMESTPDVPDRESEYPNLKLAEHSQCASTA